MIERLQENQRLDGLTQTHIIRQAAPELVVAQEMQPIEAGFLVWAQLAGETGWQWTGGYPLEISREQLAQAAALVLEFCIQAQLSAWLSAWSISASWWREKRMPVSFRSPMVNR